MDQFIEETIVAVHPATLVADSATHAVRRLMEHYAKDAPVTYWAGVISSPSWRHNRPQVIRDIAEREWASVVSGDAALRCAELQVMAIEAVAAQWQPAQCRVSAVRIDGRLVTSLVCNTERFSA